MGASQVTDVWYVVQVMRRWSSLTAMGIPLSIEAAAPGCVGFMPIFKDKASAEAWRAEQGHTSAAIAAIEAAS